MRLVFIFIPKKCFLLDLSNTQISKYYYYYYYYFFFNQIYVRFFIFIFLFWGGVGVCYVNFFLLVTESMIIKYTINSFTSKIDIIIVDLEYIDFSLIQH